MQGAFLFSLSLVTFVAFFPSLQAAYLRWDDTKHIIENVHVYMPLGLHALSSIFTAFVNSTYIPLTTLSFHLQHHMFGLDPFISHLINVLGHMTIVGLVFIFCVRLGISVTAAMIASSIFALHPMHVESIAWATERKDILCAFFYLLTLITYQEYLRTSKKHFFWFSVALGLCSILSKAMAVSIPWVLLLLDWSHDGSLKKKHFQDKVPFALIIFPIAALTFFQLDGHPAVLFPNSILIFIWSAAFYIHKFFWPYPLLPLYSPDYPVTLQNPAYWSAATVLGISMAATWFYRKNKLLLMGAFFYITTIFFFFRVDLADINVVADRFIYLPSIGLCIVLGILLSRTYKVIPFLLCIVLGALTFNQCRIWQNDTTLWTHVLYHQPYNQLAKEKYRQLKMAGIKPKVDYPHFDQMLQRVPDKAKAYLKRGNSLAASGNFEMALHDFNAAIALNPNLEEAYMNRGNVFQAHGDFKLALADFDKAIALNRNSSALLSKAILLGLNHQPDQALIYFQAALSTNKDLDRALYERGFFFAANNQCDKAIADFSAAIIHHPKYSESYFQRGLCARKTGNLDLAGADFAQVIALEPDHDKAYGEACGVAIKQQHLTTAVQHCTRAISLYPFDAQYFNDRARAYFLLGKYDKAQADMDRVIALDPSNIQARLIHNQIGQFVNSK